MIRREFLTQTLKFGGALALLGGVNLSFAKGESTKNIQNITLNNGVKIPQLGFGTWRLSGSEGQEAILEAFKAGYRLIDSASAYMNEVEVGEAFRQSGLKREEVFITTKIAREKDAKKAFDESLKRLGFEYIDLYLLHWSTQLDEKRWKTLESLYKEGKVRAIGVSNFNESQIKNLLDKFKIVPAINQIELHPFLVNKGLIEFCKKQGIAIEAYTPLGNIKKSMKNATLKSIAKKHKKSVAQVMLRWSIQNGFIAIPKSGNPQRMRENLDIFDFKLDESDLNLIAKLPNEGVYNMIN